MTNKKNALNTDMLPARRYNGFALAQGKVELSPIGLTFHTDIDQDEWSALGGALHTADQGIQWAIGDWYNYGADKGYVARGKAKQIAEAVGLEPKSVQDFGYVARRYESSRRLEDLSFAAHHSAVTLLPRERMALLEKAAEEGWSHKQVRSAARELKGLTDPKPKPTSAQGWHDALEAAIGSVARLVAQGKTTPLAQRQHHIDRLRSLADRLETLDAQD